MDDTRELLLEIGCEEMPASWLPGLTSQLALRFVDAASRERLTPEGLRSLSGSRRLVLRADLAKRQEDREEQVWGPPLTSARDASGGWTKAASGFAKKCGIAPEELSEGAKDPSKPTEMYLLFVRQVTGRPTVEVLPGIVAQTLRALAFPKRMSWDAWLDDGRGAFPFGRPIRWLVLLFGGEVVPFSIRELVAGGAGPVIIRSGRETRGHRFLPREHAGEPVAVNGFANLVDRLRERNVLVEVPERETRIRAGLEAVASNGSVAADHGLVLEWIHLVEFPTVVGGQVAAEFRRLPREVLETVLVHHQKSVPVVEKGIVTGFAALTNTDGSAAAEIVRGMERVVVARLRDGSFFWDEDRKRLLADRVEDLSGVVFHQGLGTYRDKAERLVRLVGAMADEGWIAPADRDACVRAARLAKADLTTLVVREFPELQGIMGGLYLEAAGETDPAVAKAVRWHYHPISVEEGSTPATDLAGRDARVFAAVAAADKLDTLAGYFGIGLVPTGSSDPYGLRRAAQGAVRAVVEFWGRETKRPSLIRMAELAFEGYDSTLKRSKAEVLVDLGSFLVERLRNLLQSGGFPADEVEAVLNAVDPGPLEDPAESRLRLVALHRVRSEFRQDFDELGVAFKRARNILAGQTTGVVDPGLLKEEAEKALHESVRLLAEAGGDYDVRLRALAGLRGPVDRFFDDVLVMAEDPKVRANRLGLLQGALSLFYRIADISRLGG